MWALPAHHGTTKVDLPMVLGASARVLCRLVAVRVPQEGADQRRRRLHKQAREKGKSVSASRLALCAWTIFVTHVPADRLDVAEVLVLGRVRWQSEWLFKLWKRHDAVDESRSQQAYHVLCDVYAKLLAMVVQLGLFLTSLWAYPDRSLMKAAKGEQHHALPLAAHVADRDQLCTALTCLARAIVGCRINQRKQHPNLYQLLLDASPLSIGEPVEP